MASALYDREIYTRERILVAHPQVGRQKEEDSGPWLRECCLPILWPSINPGVGGPAGPRCEAEEACSRVLG